jgi:hypothetical protein
MNPYFQKHLVIGFCLFAGWASTICAQNESIDSTAPKQAEKVWRGGWLNHHKEKDPQVLVDTARKLGFSALMIHAGDDFAYLNDLCERARKARIDIYYSFLITGTPKNKEWWQVVSPADAEKLRRIKEDKSPEKNGYQYGGEPINDQTDIHETEFLCFHRPEVFEYSIKKLEDILQKCPCPRHPFRGHLHGQDKPSNEQTRRAFQGRAQEHPQGWVPFIRHLSFQHLYHAS